MLNEFSQSVFSHKISLIIKEIEPENQEVTNCSVSKNSRQNIFLTLDPSKARGPDGLPPVFYPKTCNKIVNCRNKTIKNGKSFRKIPDCWQQFPRFSRKATEDQLKIADQFRC